MNRFAALGLAAEAFVTERRVIVLTPRREDISAAIACFEAESNITECPGFRVRRTNGDECIDFGGRGRIDFTSAASSLRGLSADVVFIDDDADRLLTPARRAALYADLEHVTAASEHGEVVRA